MTTNLLSFGARMAELVDGFTEALSWGEMRGRPCPTSATGSGASSPS